MNCPDFKELLWLYLYDELPAEERAAADAHLAACPGCRAEAEEARRLHQLLSKRRPSEPSPQLLVQCRQALDETIDREELGWRGLIRGWLAPWPGALASRAIVALALAMFGFSLGWTLRPHAPGILPGANNGVPSPTAADLMNSRISGITQVAPNPQTGEVRITLDAQRRVTLEGSLDDPRIQQVLVYALKNYDNPGIRRDTLDALRARPDNPNVRQALLYAMRRDVNPGVRLEALEAAQGMDWGPEIKEALFDSLQHDRNEGVRVAAINVLVQHADQQMVPVLQQFAARDPSFYVRMKSARAVRELLGDDF